jgi:hypothetical protein
MLMGVKDVISQNMAVTGRELGLNDEQLRKLIFSAQAAVDTVGGNAFNALSKSSL